MFGTIAERTARMGRRATPRLSRAWELLSCCSKTCFLDGFSLLRAIGAKLPGGVHRPGAGSAAFRLERLEDRTVLSPLFVTSSADSGPGSLRAAVLSAPSGSTIQFASSVHDITLTSGQIDIATNLDIKGPGASSLSINGNHASRVFDISNNAIVAIDQLTITSGQTVADNGGGILIEAGATLNLDHVVMTNNQAKADSTGIDGARRRHRE